MDRTLLIGLLLLGACSARPLPADLATAESLEHAGRHAEALPYYERATRSCRALEDDAHRRRICADAYLGHAELLVTLGRRADAGKAYAVAAAALSGDRPSAAQALYRRGRLLLELGQEDAGAEQLWAVIAEYPEQPFAADAVERLLQRGRDRRPLELARVFRELADRLGDTAVGDNLHAAVAVLAEEELGDPRLALAYWDRVRERYPERGYADDAYWRGARIARELGDAAGAARRLRAFLATREVAWGSGSYLSVHHDDAQLELGRVLRDDLGDTAGAIEAFTILPEHYPDSILHDDALYERAVTWAAAGDRARACADLARLAQGFPDSKFELEKAPALRRRLGCGA